jgi:hypothetical protein
MKLRRCIPLLLLLAGIAVAIPAERSLRKARVDSSLGASETGWVRYVMVGLGGFRGVVSEVLWIRATTLQEEGRYFELIQLADWITALDPRAAEAWVFNAWNLSYNVPAMLPDHRSRLNWVRAGIDLLKDKAIPANPDNPRLYRELGWLYQNKVGSNDDPAAHLYRQALAEEFANRNAVIGNDADSKLDAAIVDEIEKVFGTVDWRLAPSHAIYWAWRGLKCAPKGFEREALRRMVRQNGLTLVMAGRLTGDRTSGKMTLAPDLDKAKGLISFCEDTLREDPNDAGIYSLTLANLVQIMAAAGREDDARRLYGRFCELMKMREVPAPTFEQVLAGDVGE